MARTASVWLPTAAVPAVSAPLALPALSIVLDAPVALPVDLGPPPPAAAADIAAFGGLPEPGAPHMILGHANEALHCTAPLLKSEDALPGLAWILRPTGALLLMQQGNVPILKE